MYIILLPPSNISEFRKGITHLNNSMSIKKEQTKTFEHTFIIPTNLNIGVKKSRFPYLVRGNKEHGTPARKDLYVESLGAIDLTVCQIEIIVKRWMNQYTQQRWNSLKWAHSM